MALVQVQRDDLHFLSVSPNTISASVMTNGYGGTRLQFGFKTSTAGRQTIKDPNNMLSTHASSTADSLDICTIQSTGDYLVGLGVGSVHSSILQELLLVRNRIRRDQGNDIAVTFGDASRVLHLNQPVNSGLSNSAMSIYKTTIKHFLSGDTLTIEEDGASTNSMSGLSFALRQLNRNPTP